MVYHVMVIFSVLVARAVDRGFETRSGQTKDYKIGICCFSAKHAALRRKIKDWLAGNQDNVSERGDMSTNGLLFQCASIIQIWLSVLFLYKADLIIFSLKINLLSPWHSLKIAALALNNNHSLNIEVYAPSQKCAQSCVCVTGMDFVFFSTIFLLYFCLFSFYYKHVYLITSFSPFVSISLTNLCCTLGNTDGWHTMEQHFLFTFLLLLFSSLRF
jgi:hypothetical protein